MKKKIIKFETENCMFCKVLQPRLEELVVNNDNVELQRIVVEANNSYGIVSVPTIYIENEDGSRELICSGAGNLSDILNKIKEKING